MTINRVIKCRRQLYLCQLSSNVNLEVRRWKTSKYLTDEYQYLQRGQIPMLHFQRSLPRLPVPNLEKTCERYLAALSPLTKDVNEFKRAQEVVNKFRTGIGEFLQRSLIEHDKANKHTSYISQPWFDMYLSDRKSLPVNYNPILVMKTDEKNGPQYNDQIIRASNIIISTLRFMRTLRENKLAPEVYYMDPKTKDKPLFNKAVNMAPQAIATFVAYAFKAYPLDMSQYQGLFGGTRVPEVGKDRIFRDHTTTHICVLKQGHIFAVNVLDNDGNIVPPKVLLNRLKHVVESSKAQKPAEYPLGILTTEERNKWADIREHLLQTNNEAALQTIDTALFCVALDDQGHDLSEYVPIVQNMLHGKNEGVINRWYDKSLSLIVTKEGLCGINFEHSWGDGVAILRLFNEVYSDSVENPFCNPDDKKNAAEVSASDTEEGVFLVEFNLDDLSKRYINEAKAKYVTLLDSLDTNFMIYYDMNKQYCKQHRVSPDAIMQLGFQLAFLKQTGEYVGTYESASTAAFLHGRTETIRPCTAATKEVCDAIVKRRRESQSLKDVKLREMIVNCSKAHGLLIRDAAMGQGFDRHLFGLKHIGQTLGIEPDSLYKDQLYKKLNCNILSSSALTSPALYAGGFGPVETNGYGIGYNILDMGLGTIVTNYKAKRNGAEFSECLKESYDDIKNILDSKKD